MTLSFAVSDSLAARAAAAEPKTTADVVSLTRGIRGAKNDGLEYRLKSAHSLKRKIATHLRVRGKSVEEIVARINDAVRYIVSIPDGDYSLGADGMTEGLRAKGYEQVELANYWNVDGYKGVNSTWRDPATGQLFEMQFHSPDSLAAKMQEHVLYEKRRLPDTSAERSAELMRKANEIVARGPIPPGAPDVGLRGP